LNTSFPLKCRGDDAGAEMFGQLNGEARDTAGAALDQDGLAGFQLQRVLDRAERGEAGERERRGIDVRAGLASAYR
jgi:hypothetical protein